MMFARLSVSVSRCGCIHFSWSPAIQAYTKYSRTCCVRNCFSLEQAIIPPRDVAMRPVQLQEDTLPPEFPYPEGKVAFVRVRVTISLAVALPITQQYS